MKTVFAALLLAAAVNVQAQTPAAAPAPAPNRYAATIEPAERFDAGVLAVQRHGNHGRPLILIPGLASGAWVWQDTVRRFSPSHVIYVVTLPGFDGRAPVTTGGPVFEQAKAALHQLIVSRKLDHPVLVGHSLGATLALAVAENDAALLGGVVAIDGLPVMPGSEQTPGPMRPQMAAAIKARMAAAAPGQFAVQQQQYMRGIGVTDLAMADELARLTAKSDPAAVTDIMAEDIELDLRPGLPKISVPVLLVAPYFQPDATQRGLTEDMVKQYYTGLMAGTPKLEVVTVPQSRHFVMFDQPERLGELLQAFLKK